MAYETGTFVGRVWRPDVAGPSLVTVRKGVLIDITSKSVPTMRDLLDLDDPVAHVRSAAGEMLAPLADVMGAGERTSGDLHLLAPSDLQAIKACGVTFARSMIERVIAERAAGDAGRAEAIRKRMTALIGDSLRNLKAGSSEAARVKAALIEEGVWS
ncbi:MAG TPA: fumarylacetoacetate hydrolase, partial [Sinorhizobium sp.]|nr:fumarylacetoacetate hydrolase [Sinorhizobium sp.]